MGGMVVEGRGLRGGGDPSDYIDRPPEQGKRAEGGSDEWQQCGSEA